MYKKVKGFIAAALAAVLMMGNLGIQGTQPVKVQASEELIVNGNFADADNLAVWNGGGHNGGAVVTAEVSDTPIGDEKIMTYGKITGRNKNYNCFAFDVTDKVEKNQVYEFSFYIMLDPVDYADAPAEQRTVELSPHIRAGGSDQYSQGVTGAVGQTLEPGVWTKLVGTFTPNWNGELEMVVLRFMEQGTNFGSGPGVMGTYYITGVTLKEQDKEPELIQTGIVDLKKTVNKKLSADGEYIVGTSIVASDLSDVETMGLVTKHFNAITIGNELKPDAFLGNSSPKTETIVFNGEELLVPAMNFSKAEQILDYIYKYNEQNPNNQIKVRGHVLVWHSQTPNWFFYEDYNTSKALVSAETMTKRLEWYIATVAEHFTGENSKYKDMFYAWDVVNEAVSDGTGTYRSDAENSMWWKVYQSNEFIIQAFRFANKYMPESVDLYYNDYNEWVEKKVQGIVQLLKDVKEAEGTRIDGMGMQGHMTAITNPTAASFERAVRAYAGVVDQIQITEWDVKVSAAFINTEKGIEQEYARQAEYYHSFYETIQNLRAEGINISGMTFWGVIDTNSWLLTANSVGGGSTGKEIHYPLLFDGEYQVKPSFWAFADNARYLKAIGATPTPAPTRAVTPTPAPTQKPIPTEASAITATPVPNEASDNGETITATPALTDAPDATETKDTTTVPDGTSSDNAGNSSQGQTDTPAATENESTVNGAVAAIAIAAILVVGGVALVAMKKQRK